ncbi:hypothetical protein B0H14DRAFT_107193 [Mycena olivaceomarginata]|nr:hypothetical protein B0H14DRAFT_107193 [Mycena olivaceomarginata]
MHLLERAVSRSFTTAEWNTRNGDVEDGDDEFELGSAGEGEGDNAQPPPTSFEAGYDDDDAGSGAETAARHEEDEDEDEEDYHDTPAPHPWYKPSVPVLLALAPPIGNWLTGGDHLKDLLLLLLVFYFHQIVEVPWSLYHAARPRRPPAPRDTKPDPVHIPALRARRAARAQSALRTLDLGLLLLCLITPLLNVALLRSLALPLLSVLRRQARRARPDLLVLHRPLRPRDRPPPAARARLAHRLAHEHAPLSSPRAPCAFFFVPRQERRRGVGAGAARRPPRAGRAPRARGGAAGRAVRVRRGRARAAREGRKAGGAARRPAARGAQGARGRVPVPFELGRGW